MTKKYKAIRLGPELHKELKLLATKLEISLLELLTQLYDNRDLKKFDLRKL